MEPQPVIGVTELPDDLPPGTLVSQRTNCGCYLILRPGDPPVSEFTCPHGYFVGVTSAWINAHRD